LKFRECHIHKKITRVPVGGTQAKQRPHMLRDESLHYAREKA
jgi:hypothetical protein